LTAQITYSGKIGNRRAHQTDAVRKGNPLIYIFGQQRNRPETRRPINKAGAAEAAAVRTASADLDKIGPVKGGIGRQNGAAGGGAVQIFQIRP
jgi:hypothetical protein